MKNLCVYASQLLYTRLQISIIFSFVDMSVNMHPKAASPKNALHSPSILFFITSKKISRFKKLPNYSMFNQLEYCYTVNHSFHSDKEQKSHYTIHIVNDQIIALSKLFAYIRWPMTVMTYCYISSPGISISKYE